MQTFEEFIQDIRPLKNPVPPDTGDLLSPTEREAIRQLQLLPRMTCEDLQELLLKYPDIFPLLCTSVGLGLEQVRTYLYLWFGIESWRKVIRNHVEALIEKFDHEFHWLERIEQERRKTWDYLDVLGERRFWSRERAKAASSRGRSVEDEVEHILSKFTKHTVCLM